MPEFGAVLEAVDGSAFAEGFDTAADVVESDIAERKVGCAGSARTRRRFARSTDTNSSRIVPTTDCKRAAFGRSDSIRRFLAEPEWISSLESLATE